MANSSITAAQGRRQRAGSLDKTALALQKAGRGMAPTALWEFLGNRKNEPYVPFPAQLECLHTIKVPWPGLNPKGVPYPTIICVNCGRRWGKTTIGEKLLWNGLLAPDDRFGPPTVRLTADTEEHGQKIWRLFIWHLENTPLNALLDSYSREYQLVTLKTGATAQLLSANNPQALSGDGVTLWIVDEAQFLSWAAWDNLFPSTAERDGVIVMLGVSEGEGPYRDLCIKGDSPDYPEYLRLHYPTASNPFVPRWRIEFARRNMAPHKFKQLYLAEWVGELGKVFRNVEANIIPDEPAQNPNGYWSIEEPRSGHAYYGGIDLARLEDWTIYSIFDRNGRLIAWDRFSLVSWELQKDRLARMSARFGHPPTVVDTTGVGDPIFDDLLRLGMNVIPYRISTNDLKRVLVDELAIRVGSGQIKYPRIPELLEELNLFEAKRSPTGNVTVYSAPNGKHDDFVLSLALACQILPRTEGAQVASELTIATPEEIHAYGRHQSAYEHI